MGKPILKGKNFESEFKQSCQEQDIWIHRIKDNQLSYNSDFSTSENPYDFIAFTNSTLYLIECKCTNLSSLTISRDKKEKNKMIKKHQIDSLWKDSRYDNVFGMFLIDFKTSNNTYILYIDDFVEWCDNNDKKSISEKDILTLEPIVVQKELKKTKYRYFIQEAFEQLKRMKPYKYNHTISL